MLATINGHPQSFRMTMLKNGQSIDMDCYDFLHTREEENQLLDGIWLPDEGRVLDWGCGVGRHLMRIRQRYPSVHCCGIDICDLMLEHCRLTIAPPTTFAQTLGELAYQQFDLIMLMGNGLGVLGREQDAAASLRILVQSLSSNGRIVIETGNPYSVGYFSEQFVIDYQKYRDGPFIWGFSDHNWISQKLQEFDCIVDIQRSMAPRDKCFFAIGQRGKQDGVVNESHPINSE